MEQLENPQKPLPQKPSEEDKPNAPVMPPFDPSLIPEPKERIMPEIIIEEEWKNIVPPGDRDMEEEEE